MIPRLALVVLLLTPVFLADLGCASRPRRAATYAKVNDEGWERIGTRRVDFATDHDVIPVTWIKGDHKRIRLKVEDNRVIIRDLKIHYANGGVQDVQLRREFGAGDWSRIIDLRGGERQIDRISLTYRTAGRARRGKATVKVFAKD